MLIDDFAEEYLKIGKDGSVEKSVYACPGCQRGVRFIAVRKTYGMKNGDILKNSETGECILLDREGGSPQECEITTFEFTQIYPIEGQLYK